LSGQVLSPRPFPPVVASSTNRRAWLRSPGARRSRSPAGRAPRPRDPARRSGSAARARPPRATRRAPQGRTTDARSDRGGGARGAGAARRAVWTAAVTAAAPPRVAGGQGSLRRLTLLMSAWTTTVLRFDRDAEGLRGRGDQVCDGLELGVGIGLRPCARALDRLVHPLVHVHPRGDRGSDRRELRVGMRDVALAPGGAVGGWRNRAPAWRSPWRWPSGGGRRGSSASDAAAHRGSGSRRPCS
jgi:hypothetical protein